ncbi:ABATE domain-containing protein [Mesorhizobium sp. CA7]|uniref:ABATE domain-containing protein n=1 Tax=Mesorhizobium sp. CA7 TaxID=588501 RepID=UPI001CCDA7B8|nr:ABATE domain-containing protein [Mesorhizobium sp. CA7]MBZ9813233.1 ABATE domain-containing protein [Mesorhizobium sp. CA7]
MSLPHRIAGNLALDLANTISRRGTDREIDHLATAADILAWSRQTGLIDDDFALPSADHEALVKDVLALRRAVSDTGSAIAHGDEPPAAALDTIRKYAAEALRTAALAGSPCRCIS